MRISWKWLSELVDLGNANDPAALADILTSRGLEVEGIERQDKGFEKVVTAKLLERLPHPQADRLSLCKVSMASGAGAEQDGTSTLQIALQIVCGAQNMKAGDIVALAQIGAHLPNGLKIEQSKIRGVVSFGMLCSEQELKLKDSSEGIMILPPSTPLGRPLAEILGRDDTVLVLKLTANRGDCLSHFGLAREIAAALGTKLKKPGSKSLNFVSAPPATAKNPIAIHLNAGEAAPQFFGCMIEGVKIGPSPDWMVKRLETLGSRSINNVVDASNLVMLELGHPTHAYDATLIKGNRIGVRIAHKDEQLPLLDGQTISLSGFELVIEDAERAIGLAGVMGGGNSEVRETTNCIFLECAEFSPVLVRKAASQHQRKTEASHRFERGIDSEALPTVISRLAGLVQELAGGQVVYALSATSGKKSEQKTIQVNPGYFEKFLGMSVPAESAEKVLVGLDCQIKKESSDLWPDLWNVIIPSYRRDLSIKEDLAEEIARSLGYDKIKETIPALSSPPQAASAASAAAKAGFQANGDLLDRAKDVLVGSGLTETLNFAFTSRAWLSKFEMAVDDKLKVLNPISEECEVLVPSLLPGLIRNVLENERHHFGSEPLSIRLFEARPIFVADQSSETGIRERWKLAFAISGPRFASGLRNELGAVDFYDVKAIIENLFRFLGTKGVRFQPAMKDQKGPQGGAAKSGPSTSGAQDILRLLHPGKSVDVWAGKDVAGTFGLLHPAKAKELKIDASLWIGELDWEAIAKLSLPMFESRAFQPISEFPPMERDFALVVRGDFLAEKITQVALKAGRPLARVAKIFDIYQGSQVGEGMTSVAVRVIFYEGGRSLQEPEVEAASAEIIRGWKKELGIELRS